MPSYDLQRETVAVAAQLSAREPRVTHPMTVFDSQTGRAGAIRADVDSVLERAVVAVFCTRDEAVALDGTTSPARRGATDA
jgi:hypothetical protein